jgi:hypothetical protein
MAFVHDNVLPWEALKVLAVVHDNFIRRDNDWKGAAKVLQVFST